MTNTPKKPQTVNAFLINTSIGSKKQARNAQFRAIKLLIRAIKLLNNVKDYKDNHGCYYRSHDK